ncbi:MAG: EAL domain-containing protein, partial [Pygmaiobacter sp.]
ETQQFILYFQPKYDLPTGAIIGAEALVRWQHPQKGLILPGAFIPVFENNGFITRLDGYVWERTCQVLQGWLAAGAHPLPVSVNISRVNFYDPTLCDRLVALVKQYELTPNLLELELTESAYTENPQQLIAVTKELQRNGFVILMDDFGSGYSSLNMLKDVPVDILKIDLGFLECNANAGRGCNILSSVVRMAKWLDIPVIAEGVETCEQVNFLRGIGCNSAQGYYYSKPVPQDVYDALLAKQDSTVPEFPSVSPVCENFDLSELLNPHSTINLLFNSFSDSVGIYEFYGEKLEALRVNEGYFKMVGQPREKFSIADHNVLSILENEDRDIALCALKKAARTGSSECELRHPIGTQMMWIRARARRLADRGERQFFYIVFDDITMERKKARSLQELLDHVPAGLGVYEVGDTLRTRYISKGMHQLNGMPENEASPIVGGELSGVRAQQTEQLRRECIAAFNEGRMVDIRYPFVSADGHQHWAWAKGKMLKNDEGELLCYALVSDITTQQALEQRALEGERKLNRVFEESRMNEERYRIVQSL